MSHNCHKITALKLTTHKIMNIKNDVNKRESVQRMSIHFFYRYTQMCIPL
jgi:hypothetical protein